MRSKYVDMGDGTHALQIAVASGGDVTIPVEAASQLGLAGHVAEPCAAAAAIVTLAAGGAGVANVLAGIYWSLSDDPAAHVNLMVEDGVGDTIFSTDITISGPGFLPFVPPMRGSANTAMVVTVANPGGAVLAKLTLHAWTE